MTMTLAIIEPVGRPLARLRAVVGLSIAQLRHRRGRTVLVVIAVALAVLAVTLLASLGLGVLATGEERFAASEQDLWITAGSVGLSETGGVENPVVDSHRLAADVGDHEDVESASPLAFHGVYAGSNPDDLELVTGIGVPGQNGDLEVESGAGFSAGDVHYGGGDYDGPMTYEVVVDTTTAELFDVSVGDTLYVGSSRESARDNEFEVVGISDEYASFLGTSTVTMPLSELQRLAGTTGSDRAAFVTVSLADGADAEAVRTDLQEAHPEYEVRTSREQLESMLEARLLVIASGVMLVGLAVVSGAILTVNLLTLIAYQQRSELAALRAIGLSRSLLAGIVGGQGVVLGVLGGILGVLATPPLVRASNELAASLVGFENLLRTPIEVYAVGFAIAVLVGTVGAVTAGWRASRYARLERLE